MKQTDIKEIALMDIKRQHAEHAEEYEAAALEVMRSGKYINSEHVRMFEEAFASYVGAGYAIGVGNGTDALCIALQALGIGPGDEVITSPFTFVATAEPIVSLGAKPVFVDVNPDTCCMDPEKLEAAVTEKTKAILPVHFYGHCAEMDEISRIAGQHNLYVIEDACQAAGADYKGKRAGALGTMGCFSFFPTKTLGCAGDGGMITTDSRELAQACRALRVHGSGLDGLRTWNRLHPSRPQLDEERDLDARIPKYFNYLIGQNSRLDELQAAVLNKKLAYLDEWIARRRAHADRYNEALAGTSYRRPAEHTGCKHAYYLYVLQHPRMQEICRALGERGIGCGTYYPVPLHLQKAFEEFGYQKGDFPAAERLAAETFAVPVFPELKNEEQSYIIETLLELEKKL